MSAQRGKWIARRGQVGAESAIDQVIDGSLHAGEQVRQVADELLADSPYQARQPFSAHEVEELAQGMRGSGFQGVLIVRPHSDAAKRRRGYYQLAYGHRRRAAWRKVCEERSEPCVVPVVVRELSDAEMLTIGAQENLQRQDLDPVEEAQLVAWHERVFFGKNQAEIGSMLGKSSDWVSVRARIHRLPGELKVRLRQRPRAIAQMLELGVLFVQQPEETIALADRVVQENLSLDAVRALVRGYNRPERPASGAPPTAKMPTSSALADGRTNSEPASPRREPVKPAGNGRDSGNQERKAVHSEGEPFLSPIASGDAADWLLLEEAAAAVELVASRASGLPRGAQTTHTLDRLARALDQIRQVHEVESRHGGSQQN
jgi:ParB family transcriptional regulator, chromosome partitioning protein